MKQSLQIRLGQQLTMTPQLQQAIRLLQLSTVELQTEIRQALDSNIMLEEVDEDIAEENDNNENSTDADTDDDKIDDVADIYEKQIIDELPTDSNWEDTFDYDSSSYKNNSSNVDKEFLLEHSKVETLQDSLMWQLELAHFSTKDRIIALAIVNSLENDGYLRCDLEDIQKNIINYDKIEIEIEEVKAVLKHVQSFDPVGVAARDLSECLLIQFNLYDKHTKWRDEAIYLLKNHLDLLSKRDYLTLMRRMKLAKEELMQVVALIQKLNPRPGNEIDTARIEYVVPDVFVKKINNSWLVELNHDLSPKLGINNYYVNLIKRATNKGDSEKLKSHLQEARWMIKSIKSRYETLLKVTMAIVERQADFFEYGEAKMKPLVLHDIADKLEMHESTISRVTTRKYLHTPRGVFELKYFFSSHVSTKDGGECSSTAIRALIKTLIANENVGSPLSDNKIAKVLANKGIKIARRTIAKYRESMSIPSSNERKCLI
jgi:RNA polymerase sigma-54 factor